MIYSHKLSSKNKRHKKFLEEERNDPITGDKIIEGNEIVLCGACKSAFLLDSWNYMARSHCNQPFTLKEIPTKQHVVKELEPEKEYFFDKATKTTIIEERIIFNIAMGVLLFPVIVFLSMKFLDMMTAKKPKIEDINQQSTIWLWIVYMVFILIVYFILYFSKELRFVKITTSELSFCKKKKKAVREYYLSQIELIRFFIPQENSAEIEITLFLLEEKTKSIIIKNSPQAILDIKELQKLFEVENKISFVQAY
ncbi:hypothetical protein ACE193_20640 [Bernardetia sp. OM2101]|uniref:hypothetical protein n=1 Tax=Bernardetia sp. OM2101 TaxID=3344876 RepID=UPI0035D04F40